jgi:hypothetical protein
MQFFNNQTIYMKIKAMEMNNKFNIESLRTLINESIDNLIYEGLRDQMSFGVAGPIPLNPASSLCDDIDQSVLDMVDSGERVIPRRMIGDPKYFGNTKIWQVYQNYSAATLRRADLGRKPVSFFTFLNRVRNGWKGGELQYFESDGNILIGTYRQGVFLCIYFAPKTPSPINMIKFIKEICTYDNVVFSVTDDMGQMLERLGCPKYGDVKAKHNGHDCDKVLYATTQEAANTGAKLVNLLAKSSDLGNNVKNALMQNPKLSSMLDDNPNLPFEVMNIPQVTTLLMNNPDVVDTINNNPAVLQQITTNPLEGLMAFLQAYKNQKFSQSTINERKIKK